MNKSALLSGQLKDLGRGALTDLLRRRGSTDWLRLASPQIIEESVSQILACVPARGVARFNPSQVAALAKRLLLARNAELLEKLCPLWREFGTHDSDCKQLVAAVRRVVTGWPGGISGVGDAMVFSGALADFLDETQVLAYTPGPLGDAIRESRMFDDDWAGGFPVVLRGDGDNLSPSVQQHLWVETVCGPVDSMLTNQWAPVWQRAGKALGTVAASIDAPSLPNWFQILATLPDFPIETLESAGLCAAFQALALYQERPLPFGVGFTGRWDENGKLRGVADLTQKLQAAADAGVFLLFACKDTSEPMPQPTAGVRLALLNEHLSLAEVIRRVNRVCAESGVTEYRWRQESGKLQAPRPSTTFRFTSSLLGRLQSSKVRRRPN
jgi:hypothetical protein